MNKYSAELSNNVLTVRFPDVKKGWEQWLFLSSDRHHDNAHSDWDLQRAHLKEAKKRDALIIDAGDFFCLMQGKFDPRKDYDELRPEYKTKDYADEVRRDAIRFHAPYANNYLLIGQGNHETEWLRRHNHDIIRSLVDGLNDKRTDEGHTFKGMYGGWIQFKFRIHKTVKQTINLKYFHGAGAGAPVTKGTIQTNRQAVYLPDANIVLNGHNHNQYVLPLARERLSQMGKLSRDIIWFARTPGYKDEYREGGEGFQLEKGSPPRPLGGVWVKFSLKRTNNSEVTLHCTPEIE